MPENKMKKELTPLQQVCESFLSSEALLNGPKFDFNVNCTIRSLDVTNRQNSKTFILYI